MKKTLQAEPEKDRLRVSGTDLTRLAAPENYDQLIAAITEIHKRSLERVATAVNQALVLRNWLIGVYLVEYEQAGKDRARYGENLLAQVSEDLKARGLRGLSVQMLERTRQFYLVYPQVGGKISSPPVRKKDQKSGPAGIRKSSSLMRKSKGLPPLSPELVLRFSWTQLIELIRLDDPLKRAFYEIECLKGNWSVRQLKRQIGSLFYERTGLSQDKVAMLLRDPVQDHSTQVKDLIRDPYVLEFAGLAERPEYSENDLEKALLDHLQAFLLELGIGFCFEARQKRITVGNKHDYVDLIFYHRLLRCHVLLDLKIRAFRHGDAGQMNFYLNWIKANLTAEGDSPPVGIILCSDKEKTEVEYATAGMDNNLFVSRYLVALPSPEQLRTLVEKDREHFEAQMKGKDEKTKRQPSRSGRTRKTK